MTGVCISALFPMQPERLKVNANEEQASLEMMRR